MAVSARGPALNQFYTPDEREVEWVHNKARLPWSRICLLTLLKTFQTLGYFPTWQDIPAQIIEHVSACCGLIFVPEVPTDRPCSSPLIPLLYQVGFERTDRTPP